MAQANIKAVITADDRASATLGIFGNNVDTLGTKITGALKIAGVAAFAAVATGITAATKASWDQVDAVQQATVALKAYEKDGSKVNDVLSDLVKYARSDLGVLFNRKDLFQSAQSLKLMGDNTGDLVNHVKILSRSVGLGLSNWDELNLIVGRVGSTGRLTGDDFDNLTKAGFKLDSRLRNTKTTFGELFTQLDKGIPAGALAGQAETIKGKMIRLETAFRGVGDSILGVDKDSGQFIRGGLGDQLVIMLGKLTDFLKTPEIKQGFSNLGKGLASFSKDAAPVIRDTFKWIIENKESITNSLLVIGAAFVTLKTVAIIHAATVELAWVSAATASSVAWTVARITMVAEAIATGAANAAAAITSSSAWEGSAAASAAAWVANLTVVRAFAAGTAAFLAIPMVMPAIVVAAAIASLIAVQDAANKANDAITGAQNAINQEGQMSISLIKDARAKYDAGKISKAELERLLKIYARAEGGPVTAGSPYIVGEKGPEMFMPKSSGTIIPNNKMSGTKVIQNTMPNITIHVGAFMGTQTDARKLAKMIFDAYKETQMMGGTA